jgi:hypothetical protein
VFPLPSFIAHGFSSPTQVFIDLNIANEVVRKMPDKNNAWDRRVVRTRNFNISSSAGVNLLLCFLSHL